MLSIPTSAAEANCSRYGAYGVDLTELLVRRSNRNGNALRPYLKCLPCDKFVTFTDHHGINPRNQPCDCDILSRLQLAGKAKGRKLHFVCATRTCTFYTPHFKSDGEVVVVAEDLIGLLADMNLI